MARRPRNKLGRRRASKEPKHKFHVLCEGQNTEPQYFRALSHQVDGALISIVVQKAVGTPVTIANNARNLSKSLGLNGNSRRRKNSYEKNDQVWAVFDRDDHPNVNEALSICENSKIGIAYSNPCFELWLIFHLQDYAQPNSHNNVQRRFSELEPTYNQAAGKICDFETILNNLEDAENRGQQSLNDREREGDRRGNPSTSVQHLTRAIRDAADKAK